MQIIGENLFLALTNALWNVFCPGNRRRLDERPGLGGGKCCPAAFRFRLEGFVASFRSDLVGQRFGWLEFHQYGAGVYMLAVLHMNGGDLAGLQRLDDLDTTRWLKLALRDRQNIEMAKIPPGQDDDHEKADRRHKGHADR